MLLYLESPLTSMSKILMKHFMRPYYIVSLVPASKVEGLDQSKTLKCLLTPTTTPNLLKVTMPGRRLRIDIIINPIPWVGGNQNLVKVLHLFGGSVLLRLERLQLRLG